MRYARASRRAIEWERDPASSRRFAGPAEQNGGAFPELRALLARFTAGYALDYLADDLHARARLKLAGQVINSLPRNAHLVIRCSYITQMTYMPMPMAPTTSKPANTNGTSNREDADSMR